MEHPADCRDAPVLAAEARDRRRAVEDRWAPGAWDAWDVARPDEAVDAERPHLPLADADAGKSAVQELGGLVQDASCPRERSFAESARLDEAVELYTPAGGQSAERSCAALAAVAAPQQPEDAVQQEAAVERQKRQWGALAAPVEQLQKAGAEAPGAEARQPRALRVRVERLAFRPLEARRRAAAAVERTSLAR